MNFIKRFTQGFTTRGRTLAQVEQGMALAKNKELDKAIKLYSEIADSSESPRDVMAMAIFNRALAYKAIGKQREAKQDLKAILEMPEPMTKIKRSASDKLVRMQREVAREKQPAANGDI